MLHGLLCSESLLMVIQQQVVQKIERFVGNVASVFIVDELLPLLFGIAS